MKRNWHISLSFILVAGIVFLSVISVSAMSLTQGAIQESNYVDPFAANKSQLTFAECEKSLNTDISESKQVDIFFDNQKNQFIFNQEGKQVGYIKNSAEQIKTRTAPLQEDEIKSIANHILEILADSYLYALCDYIYEEYSDTHILTYYRYVNGYRSSDFIFITLSSTGELLAYAAPNINSFSNITIPEINEDKYKFQLFKVLSKKYGSEMKEYVILDEPMIVLNNNILEFQVNYAITFQDGTKTADIYSFAIQ